MDRTARRRRPRRDRATRRWLSRRRTRPPNSLDLLGHFHILGLNQMAATSTQLDLAIPERKTWGGRRAGAGRPKSGRRVGVPHRARPFHDKNHPEHVTWRVVRELPSLRIRKLTSALGEAIRANTKWHAARR